MLFRSMVLLVPVLAGRGAGAEAGAGGGVMRALAIAAFLVAATLVVGRFILPRALARPLRGWAARGGKSLNVGVHLKTSSVFGYLLLRSMAWLRPLRRMSSRYAAEQARIESWLAAVAKAAAQDAALALEVAQCARLLKGYGDTHHRGWSNFERIMATLVEGEPQLGPAERTVAIRKARLAALADAEGKALANEIGKAKPVVWMKATSGNG